MIRVMNRAGIWSGVLLGAIIGSGLTFAALHLISRGDAAGPERSASDANRIWTCSMHPQIRMRGPGRCPICGMELVPVGETGSPADDTTPDHLALGAHARAMARVATVPVEERELFREIHTVGRIELDETAVAHIAARVDGRVDEVFASFPGSRVKQGDHLVRIYSPLLLTAQEEFLISRRRGQERTGPTGLESLEASARTRLELLGVTAQQIDELARIGKAQAHLVVFAPIGGTVLEKNIRAGQYVREGDSLYTIADLSHVWLLLDVYESDLSWVRFGQPVTVTLESEPAAQFTGTVGFIEPVLNDMTRTVRVRVLLRNEGGNLKPAMYAQSLIRVPIMPDGGPAPTGLEGKYACPMHPYIVADTPGSCTVCGMPLERVPGDATQAGPQSTPRVLALPAEAVLTTGRRQIVYIEDEPGTYRPVQPRLGPRAGDFFPVLSGLKTGDRVVARGGFLLDSQFQIMGKPSLLYPEGTAGGGITHAGHGGPVGPAQEPSSHPPSPQPSPHSGH